MEKWYLTKPLRSLIYVTFLCLKLMNKAIVAGLAAGVLVVGLILSPVFSGFPLFTAQADHPNGGHKSITLIADEVEVQVAPDNPLHPGGIMYSAMVFNGTIPGPVISVHQGDTVEITLRNEGNVIHSIDFHAGFGPSKALSGNVAPGESKTWTLEAVNAGVFYYHCGADSLNGIWEHIANGMYGGIVVHPHNQKPAKEFYVVFGEIYNSKDGGPFVGSAGETGSFDLVKLWTNSPDLMLTNGMAHKYVPAIGAASQIVLNPDLNDEIANGDLSNVFVVKPGELTRWYLVNPGPNQFLAFHFISGMIDVRDGSIKNRYGTQLMNDETWTIPPGSASVIESVFPEEGLYVGVSHSMEHVLKGAAFAVVASNASTDDDHPPGTMVTSMEDSMMG
jgi:nitrite reductase (NO-forming)